MVDLDKRHFTKPWMLYDETKMIKQHPHHDHLPRLKQTVDHSATVKYTLPPECKRRGSTVLPPIIRSPSFGLPLATAPLIPSSNHVEPTPPPPPPVTFHSTAAEPAASRVILRQHTTHFSNESSARVTHSVHPKRSSRYSHIQARIDTGLPRGNSNHRTEPDIHQLEPLRPLHGHELKHEIEQDVHIRTHSKRIHFNSGMQYATQLTTLGNLIRTKVKTHLASATSSGDERYKIIVHLTIFPTTAVGLHVASRCLWNTHTDNSITIKMKGVDCDILVIVFLSYTDLGAI